MYNNSFVGKTKNYGIPAMDALPYIYDKCVYLHKLKEFDEVKSVVFFKSGVYFWTDGVMYIRIRHQESSLNTFAGCALDKYSRRSEQQGQAYEDYSFESNRSIDIDLFEELSTTTAREVVDLDAKKKKTIIRIADKWFAAKDIQAMVDLVHFFDSDINAAKWSFKAKQDIVVIEASFKNDEYAIYILCTSFKEKKV